MNLKENHRKMDVIIHSLSLIFYPILKLKLCEKYNIPSYDSILKQCMMEYVITPHIAKYEIWIRATFLTLILNEENMSYENKIIFTDKGLNVMNSIHDILEILSHYEPHQVERIIYDLHTINLQESKSLLLSIEFEKKKKHIILHMIDKFHLPKDHRSYTMFKLNYQMYEDIEEIMKHRDISSLKTIQTHIQDLTYMERQCVDKIIENHFHEELWKSIFEIPQESFYSTFIPVVTQYLYFVRSVELIYVSMRNTILKFFYSHQRFNDILVKEKQYFSSITHFFSQWLCQIVLDSNDSDIQQKCFCYFEFFTFAENKDSIIEQYIEFCEKELLLRENTNLNNHVIILYHLEIHFVNHFYTYKYTRLIEDYKESHELFGDMCLVLSYNIWKSPLSISQTMEPVTFHPSITDHLAIYEMIFEDKYSQRKIQWDLFHTMGCYEITDETMYILPIYALNLILIHKEKDNGILRYHPSLEIPEKHWNFWFSYIETNGLLDDNQRIKILPNGMHEYPIPDIRVYLESYLVNRTPMTTIETMVERPEVVQSTMMKIMKRKKQCKAELLRSEVISVIQLFTVQQDFYETQKQKLIEKEYLSEGDDDMIYYVN
jgi:hypothetical protein